MARRRRNLTHTKMAGLMSSRWQSFPNVAGLSKTLGEYCQFSQTIHLISTTEAELQQAFNGGSFTTKRDVLTLLAHEVRHFGDHVGTLWGRRNLVHLFDAYNVRLDKRKSEFGRVTQVLRDMRDDHLSGYYTEELDPAAEDWDGKQWLYRLSCGVHVNSDGSDNESKPILFTWFSNNSGEELCRVPFSVASLLEIRAMSNEIFQWMGLVVDMADQGEKLVEQREWRSKAIQRMYDPFLAVYSVAAHYLSATMRSITDLIEAYLIGGEIAGVCLNMPRKFFPQLRVPSAFEPFGKRNDAMKKNCDRGYLYAVLVKNYQSSGLTSIGNLDEWLTGALAASGLPSLTDINAAVPGEDAELVGGALGGPVRQRLDDLLSVGRPYLEHLCAPRKEGDLMFDPATPPVLTSDNKFFSLPNWPSFGTFARPADWHMRANGCYRQVQEFLDACVI